MGILTSWNPLGPSRPVTGLLLPLYMKILSVLQAVLTQSLLLVRVNFLTKLVTASFARMKLVRKLSYELSTKF